MTYMTSRAAQHYDLVFIKTHQLTLLNLNLPYTLRARRSQTSACIARTFILISIIIYPSLADHYDTTLYHNILNLLNYIQSLHFRDTHDPDFEFCTWHYIYQLTNCNLRICPYPSAYSTQYDSISSAPEHTPMSKRMISGLKRLKPTVNSNRNPPRREGWVGFQNGVRPKDFGLTPVQLRLVTIFRGKAGGGAKERKMVAPKIERYWRHRQRGKYRGPKALQIYNPTWPRLTHRANSRNGRLLNLVKRPNMKKKGTKTTRVISQAAKFSFWLERPNKNCNFIQKLYLWIIDGHNIFSIVDRDDGTCE